MSKSIIALFSIMLITHQHLTQAKCCIKQTLIFDTRNPSDDCDAFNATESYRRFSIFYPKKTTACLISVCGDGKPPGEGIYCGDGKCNVFGCDCDGGCVPGNHLQSFEKLHKDKIKYLRKIAQNTRIHSDI